MLPTDSIRVDGIPPASARERADALLWARMALMSELEASLQTSRNALVALDLAGIERGTSEQVGLIEELDALTRRSVAPLESERPLAEQEAHGPTPGLEEEVRRSAYRILEASRLHAALLARAQWKLRVLANILAGPSVTYGPLLARNGGLARALDSK
jgi:hypothetical protein